MGWDAFVAAWSNTRLPGVPDLTARLAGFVPTAEGYAAYHNRSIYHGPEVTKERIVCDIATDALAITLAKAVKAKTCTETEALAFVKEYANLIESLLDSP